MSGRVRVTLPKYGDDSKEGTKDKYKNKAPKRPT